ncbi:FAD-binding domain-containing protein [Aulographum hederae CBS 113979]|uniref:FAD-binding domain-containing protein n=1 Tax=Aulographum hederae CBS 113979 TaxID=1176131 RepID=A0A6G1GMT7_9PEZI|nr:FAD-binding domain-containing protein [Aulographum hederae CBS 113979]
MARPLILFALVSLALASPVQDIASAAINSTTPSGCRAIAGDASWPSPDVWTAALPGVMPRAAKDAKSGEPDYRFKPKTFADVQAAVNFAREHNVRLSVLNSGHDFLGRNMASSGLWVDISGMDGIQVSASYVPTMRGTPSVAGKDVNTVRPIPNVQAAVTFGAGTSTQALNDALDKSGLFSMGAAHGAVTAGGGYLLTAGHAPLSRTHGLAADNALEFKLITADGSLRIANAISNPDLFWGLRGGGGLTFGIVVEATVKAFPTPKMSVLGWWLNSTSDELPIYEAGAELLRAFPGLEGVSGYYNFYPGAIKGDFFTAGPDSSVASLQARFAPLLQRMQAYPGMKPIVQKTWEYPTYKSWFDARFGPLCGGDDDGMAMPEGIIPMDSHLLGAAAFASPGLAQALKDATPHVDQGILRGHFVAGGQVMRNVGVNSVNPAWRRAYTHLIAVGAGRIGKGMGEFNVDSLKSLVPGMGAYANEASATEPSWKSSFWGSNYARLSTLKSRWDPTGVFWVSPGINADHFSQREGRVCSTGLAGQTSGVGGLGGQSGLGGLGGLGGLAAGVAAAPAFDNTVIAEDPDSNEDALTAFPGQPALPIEECGAMGGMGGMGGRKNRKRTVG